VLLAWGMDPDQLFGLIDTALFGFSIGEMRISFAAIGYAILVFALFVVGTRIIQRFLERRMLPQTGLDIGAQNSIKTGFGYVGVIIAILAATSALGINLENLAIIAGALSVGIGFGLQNVVNNFVSGLILLVERPIKVGDWVIVGGYEGIVKRISVRATEIVTFQRASVLIPNSELISGAVQNWTLKDVSARVDAPVGVAYGSDVAKVTDLLLDCGRKHPEALSEPEPSVIFVGFGDSSLDFILRVHIGNAMKKLRTLSELNYAINTAFAENGIEIPFPQRDLHVRSAEGLADVMPRPPALESPR
jgi:small-conductance mechanosensitive channel